MTGPSEGYVLGVDLGTSHTVAMLRHPDGRTRPLLFDGQPLLPSATYLDASGRLHVGADALRLGNAEPARIEPNPKRHVDDGSVLLGDQSVPVADLLAALLGAVAREATATAGFLPPAVLTHPASWGAARRAVLTDALGRAGWPASTRLVPEPVAAARYFADVLRRPVPAGSSLAVFDFGGGTLDIAVVRNEGPGPEGAPRFTVTASGGADDLGGLDLDAALVDHLGKSLAGAEPEAWHTLTEPVTLAQWRARRRFWEDVRGAKEMLSRSSFAPVPVPGVEHAVHLTRDELEAAASPLVRRGVAEAGAVLAAAGVAAGDLAGLFLVGGSSRVPLVARLLHSELGVAPTVLEQPELPVAEGAILVAGAAPAQPAYGAGASTQPQRGAGASTQPEHGAGASTQPAGGAGASTQPAGGAEASTQPAGGAEASTQPAGGAAASTQPAQSAGASAQPGQVAGAEPVQFTQGTAAAATPTPTPATLPPVPPPITDTQADSPPTPVQAAAPVQPSTPPAEPDDREYAEPVDPWATGEAAALAKGGHPLFPASAAPSSGGPSSGGPSSGGPSSGGPSSGGPVSDWPGSGGPGSGGPGSGGPGSGGPGSGGPGSGGSGFGGPGGAGTAQGPWSPPRAPADASPGSAVESPTKGRRKRPYVIGVLGLIVVLVVGAGLAWKFWPGYRALDFQALSDPQLVTPAEPISSSWADAEVIGDRVYFASTAGDPATAGVVAIDVGKTKPAWSSTQAGSAKRWKSMVALPIGVALFTDTDYDTGKRSMAVLGADDGDLLWQRTLDDDDEVYFAGKMAVIADSQAHQLKGVRLTDGDERWGQLDPAGTTIAPKLVVATTPDDLAGPATVTGRPFAPDLEDDARIVQIFADRSARVLDADGKELTSRQNVAATDDEVIAHNGRLIVRSSEGSQQILSYSLDKLGEPQVLYTPQQKDARITKLTSCGDDRICFVERASYDDKTASVVAVDAAQGNQLWSYELTTADAESLVPVGQAVLATDTSGTTLIDADGGKVAAQPGSVGRLDGGNVLEFSKEVSGYADDPSLAGRHVGDAPVQLGPLSRIRTDTCSWNTSVLACVGEKNFVLRTFAK